MSVIADISAQVRREVKQAKSNFPINLLSEYITSSPQKFWWYLYSSQSGITGLSINKTSFSKPIQIAEALNDYFSSLFPKYGWFEKSPLARWCQCQSYHSKEGVKALLLECDHRKSLGPDVLPNKFVRRYCDWASCFLAKIFNLSLCTAVIARFLSHVKLAKL